MTLGDFMAFKPAENPTEKPSEQTVTYDQFMGQEAPLNDHSNVVKPIPEEYKESFLVDMSMRFLDGVNYGFTNFNELLGFVTGLNRYDPYEKTFVTPGKIQHQQVLELTQPKNLGSKIA